MWDKWRRTEDSKKKVQRPNVAGTTTTTTTTTTAAASSSSSHITIKLLLGSDYLCVSSHRDISVTVPFRGFVFYCLLYFETLQLIFSFHVRRFIRQPVRRIIMFCHIVSCKNVGN